MLTATPLRELVNYKGKLNWPADTSDAATVEELFLEIINYKQISSTRHVVSFLSPGKSLVLSSNMPALNIETCSAMEDSTKTDEMKEKPPIKAPKGAEKLAGLYDSDEEIEVNPSGLPANFLLTIKEEQVDRYCDYLRARLTEGEGEVLVELGVPIQNGGKDSGLTEEEMEKAVVAHNEILTSLKTVGTRILNRKKGNKVTEVWMVRREPDELDFIEVRVAVVGNVDAGKSTLLGVLTHSALDDGRGAARQKLFRHKHEFETGRTSSVGNDILGFDVHGKIVNKPNPHNHNLDWVQISRESAKLVTFIDLAGHEKYLKTTIFGMTGHMPDYTMLMIGANMGVIGTTKEHLSLALSLTVPVYIVVTKIDWCPPQILEETMKNIGRLVKSARKIPVMVRTMDDVIHAATHFPSNRVCPIFQVSNVLGTNLDLLRQFLNVVPLRRSICENDPAHFQIDDVYWVEGVGTVVSGTCISGTIKINDNLVMGPSSVFEWLPLQIKSVHRKRMPVDHVRCGQTASFAFRTQTQKKITKKDVRKGMVMLDPKNMPDAGLTFEADILILHHPTTIKPNYQAMLHIGSIRQTATLIKMSKEVLRTGDRDRVTFKFIKYPEFIRPGTKMVFREGRTKAVGTVVKIVESSDQFRAKQKDKYNRMIAKRGPKPPNNKPKDDGKVNELADKMNNL